MIALQELFEFSQNDLQANRAGRLSLSQQERWQRILSRSRRFQLGGGFVFAAVVGGLLLAAPRYLHAFQLEIPPAVLPWLTAAGILMIAFPVLVALKSLLAVRRRTQNLEARAAIGQLKRAAGRVKITRTFDWGGKSYATGYVYTLSLGGQVVGYSGERLQSSDDLGQAYFAAFELPLPPEQSMQEKLKRISQVVEDPHREYAAYCLEDDWGGLHVLSIERLEP